MIAKRDFVDYLVDVIHRRGVAKIGANLFTNNLPADVQEGVALFSGLTGDKIDQNLPNYRKSSIQLLARAGTYEDSRKLIRRVAEQITFEQQFEAWEFKVNYVVPQHDPVTYPVSDGNLYESSVNFDVCFVLV